MGSLVASVWQLIWLVGLASVDMVKPQMFFLPSTPQLADCLSHPHKTALPGLYCNRNMLNEQTNVWLKYVFCECLHKEKKQPFLYGSILASVVWWLWLGWSVLIQRPISTSLRLTDGALLSGSERLVLIVWVGESLLLHMRATFFIYVTQPLMWCSWQIDLLFYMLMISSFPMLNCL